MLDHPLVEYLGEIPDADRKRFIGDALALVFPIDWPEPFGLVMIEAMACGTPVIARPRGSAPEIVDEGITGFIAENPEEMCAALRRINTIDRQLCRQRARERFSAAKMANAYEEVYRTLLSRKRAPC